MIFCSTDSVTADWKQENNIASALPFQGAASRIKGYVHPKLKVESLSSQAHADGQSAEVW